MTGSSSWIRKERRLALYIRDAFTCCYCGRDLRAAQAREMGLDHLEDLVDGGGHKGANHASSNVVTVCRRCNSSRGAKSWRAFAAQFPGAEDRIGIQRHARVNLALAKAIITGGERADR